MGRLLKLFFIRDFHTNFFIRSHQSTQKFLQDYITGSGLTCSLRFLIAWCHHLGSIWFDIITQGLTDWVYKILLNKCKNNTTRFIQAWSTAITIYCLVSAIIISSRFTHNRNRLITLINRFFTPFAKQDTSELFLIYFLYQPLIKNINILKIFANVQILVLVFGEYGKV